MDNTIFNGRNSVATSADVKKLFDLFSATGQIDHLHILNCRISQPDFLRNPMIVQDLLYVPSEKDLKAGSVLFTLSYSYGAVLFKNGLDGKTIKWYVDGQEMPDFICESEDQYGVIANGLAEVAETYAHMNDA